MGKESVESKKTNVHEGHRQRMRQRYLDSHGEGFHPHELLEMLLFYGVPRQDTNALAHELINHFGSLEEVLKAPYDALVEVPSIKENAAVLIRLVSELARRITLDSQEIPTLYSHADELKKYIANLFIGCNVERVYLLLFDNSMKLLGNVVLGEGSENCVNLVPRKIIREAIAQRATGIVLAHNHPDGIAVPSDDDRNCTFRLQQVLTEAGVPLLEHFVVAGKTVMPILHQEVGSLRDIAEPFDERRDLTKEFRDRVWEMDSDEKIWI